LQAQASYALATHPKHAIQRLEEKGFEIHFWMSQAQPQEGWRPDRVIR
jgi:hypothetical protein